VERRIFSGKKDFWWKEGFLVEKRIFRRSIRAGLIKKREKLD